MDLFSSIDPTGTIGPALDDGFNAAGREFGLGGGGGPPPAPAAPPPQPDYSPVMVVQSNNGREVAEAQINAQEMALQQTGLDHDLKRAADLELAIDKFDTHLQISSLEFKQGMVQEQNQYIEKMYAQGHREYQALTQTSNGLDLAPPPESDPQKKTA